MNQKPKTTKVMVLEFLRALGPGKCFYGYLLQSINDRARMSGLQRLRELRADGTINYGVIDHHKSKYYLQWVKDDEGNKIKPKKRK